MDVLIDRLGAHGDGVADSGDGALFVPFALPGERVTVRPRGNRADLEAVVERSPQRIEPACRHFGTCGGCALQHLAPAAYQAWKRDLVVQALASRGIEVPVADLVPGQERARRRAVFSARKTATGFLFGYNRAASHDIVDIVECPVVVPQIQAALGRLWTLAARACNTAASFHLMVTQTLSGLDVAISGSGAVTEPMRKSLVELALREGIARLAVEGETIVEAARPLVSFGPATVSPPAGGFLQAAASAEGAMAELAADHLRRARRVADLFAGSGAFTFRLATTASVHAVEADTRALAALDAGARHARNLKKITAERRDLMRRPLTAKDLEPYDGVVFDPPRAGAEAQSEQIARSTVPRVAAVSCNPTTLARDLRILIDGGYVVQTVVPVDQFLWSHHVEAVALLEKPRRR